MLLSLSFFFWFVWRAMKLCFNPTFHAWPPPSPSFPIPHFFCCIHDVNEAPAPHQPPSPAPAMRAFAPAATAATSLGRHGTAVAAPLSMVPPALGASLWRGYPGGGASWRWWCLGLAHDENWFGLKLKHPAQVDAKNGCLGLAHVGLELGLKLEPRPKLWWWWCLGLKLEPRPKLLVTGLGLSWSPAQACWWPHGSSN